MDTSFLTKLRELIIQGEKLVPEGGHEFSGYNAKMQSQYLLWRKNCLDMMSKLGDKGAPLYARIANDEDGKYFYQSSAQTVLDVVNESYMIAESIVNHAAPPPPPKPQPAEPTPKIEPKPAPVKNPDPPKEQAKEKPIPQPAVQKHYLNKVLVLAPENDSLVSQLVTFLKEIGIEAIVFQNSVKAHSQFINFVTEHEGVRCAFFVFSGEDGTMAMFQLGFLAGAIGPDRVFLIHQKDIGCPEEIPGVQIREIVVKLEEISFSLIKELKSAGYAVSI